MIGVASATPGALHVQRVIVSARQQLIDAAAVAGAIERAQAQLEMLAAKPFSCARVARRAA